MINNIRQLFNNSLIKDSMKLASSHIIMFLLPLIVTPVLSRIYDPYFFGEWGIFSSTFSILNFVLFLCYEHTIIRVRECDFSNSCWLCLLVSASVTLIVLLIYEIGCYFQVLYFLNFPSTFFFLTYCIITIFLTISQNIANRYELYWILSFTYILTGLGQALLRILFSKIVLFENGLIAGTVISQLLACLFLLIYLLIKKPWNVSLHTSWKGIQKVALENKKFPLFDAPSTLLSFAAFNLPIIILSMFFNKAEIGCYSIIIQLLLLPMSIIGRSIGKVYYQKITARGGDRNNIKVETCHVLKVTLAIAILPTLFFSLGGDKMVVMFLGDRWKTAGCMILCLCAWSIPTVLTQPLMPIYRAMNKQNILLVFNGLYFVMGIGSMVFTCLLSCPLYTILLIYALSCCVAKLLLFIDILRNADISINRIMPTYLMVIYTITITLLSYRLFCIF